jgi:hypothetical protein
VNGFRLDIELQLRGWAHVRLAAPGLAVEFDASYTPRDSITDLARAAAELAAGSPDEVVAWNTEPTQYDIRFTTAGSATRVQVSEFPDHRRGRGRSGALVAEVEVETPAVIRALWKALRRVQGAARTSEAFAAAWGHSFPTGTVERLGELVRGCLARPSVPFDPRWRTADVVGLARGIGEDRAYDRMPLLGDALMDAGADEQLLAHARAEGHVPGCWLVDLVLGRE